MLGRPVPDLLISGDGRHVGIAGEGDQLLVLRDSRSSFASDNLLEMAGMSGVPIPLAEWAGADCSREFCVVTLQRGGRTWHVLMARNRDLVEERALAAACERSDIVIADRYLPFSCHPKWLKADRNLLKNTGGLTIYLERERFNSVAQNQGDHGWWRVKPDRLSKPAADKKKREDLTPPLWKFTPEKPIWLSDIAGAAPPIYPEPEPARANRPAVDSLGWLDQAGSCHLRAADISA